MIEILGITFWGPGLIITMLAAGVIVILKTVGK